MNLPIVYEDEQILVINKPFGLVVNRAESIKGDTVQDWVEARPHFAEASENKNKQVDNVFFQRSGICHRLDKETSGCLLIAKNAKSMYYYLKLFKDRKITKTYTALVHGFVEPEQGEVVLPLKRSLFEREKWQVHYEGKKAITMWKVEKYFNFLSENEKWRNKLSLLRVGLKTGRTHQIRVHLSFLGWPIFADDKYLQKKQSGLDRKMLSHHFLHAQFLEFEDEYGKVISLKSELPDDCEGLLATLEKVEDIR